MSSKAMSLKARIRNIAKNKGIAAQVVLQNYMFERFLERVSLSEYKDKFILKGGMLIASILGLETRSTMDLDASIRAYPLDESHINTAINKICSVLVEDGVVFVYIKVEPINTRSRDFYDVYILSKTQKYDINIYQQAFRATVEHRETTEQIKDVEKIMESIKNSDELKMNWNKYKQEYSYAKNISYEMIIDELTKLV